MIPRRLLLSRHRLPRASLQRILAAAPASSAADAADTSAGGPGAGGDPQPLARQLPWLRPRLPLSHVSQLCQPLLDAAAARTPAPQPMPPLTLSQEPSVPPGQALQRVSSGAARDGDLQAARQLLQTVAAQPRLTAEAVLNPLAHVFMLYGALLELQQLALLCLARTGRLTPVISQSLLRVVLSQGHVPLAAQLYRCLPVLSDVPSPITAAEVRWRLTCVHRPSRSFSIRLCSSESTCTSSTATDTPVSQGLQQRQHVV